MRELATQDRVPYREGFTDRLAKLAMRPMLDVQVCDHCNLRCAGCLHFSPLAEERFCDLDGYARDLGRLAAIEGIGGYFGDIALMGGEPLLHPQIAELLCMTRAILPGERLTLCTNGLLLRRMGGAFWDALVSSDVNLVISPYPIRLDYEELSTFARSKGARVSFAGDVTGTLGGKEAFIRLALRPEGGCDPGESFVACPFGGHFMQLARGAIWPCQVTAHHGPLSRRFGLALRCEADDSLPLTSIISVDDMECFRRRPHPMCRHCDNGALMVAPWERSKLEAGEWLA